MKVMMMCNKIEKALEFGTIAHKGQKRKFSNQDYIIHPIGVAELVSILKDSDDIETLIISSILHDVVEDTDFTLQEIADVFGHKVASIVEEVTSDPVLVEKMGKKEYLVHKMNKMSTYGLIIKLCDRLHNVSDLIKGKSFTVKYVAETEFILNGIKNRKLTSTHKKIIYLIESKLSELR